MAENKRIDLGKTSICLKEALLRLMPQPGFLETGIRGFQTRRTNEPTALQVCFYAPQIVVQLQGIKHILIGSEEFIYKQNSCMVSILELPTMGRITNASPEKPGLAVALDLDSSIIIDLLAEIQPVQTESPVSTGVALTEADPYILDAFLRLTELLEEKERQPILALMIIWEIHYRLLTGPFGNHLRMIHTRGSQSHRIAQVISWLKTNYKIAFDIGTLADMAHMTPRTFNRHFHQLTTLSPLQYQKRLRLYEAQRLMLTENQNVSDAAYSVGYESPTQFSREYKRMFGEAPLRNTKKIRAG
jgi:AraC-like DNA-binding protein